MPLPKDMLNRLKSGFLILGGAALLVFGAWQGAESYRFLQQSGRAPGTVTRIVGERGARGMTLYYPVVRYRLPVKRVGIDFKSKPGLWPSPFDAGDAVEVVYDPADPGNARIVSFWTLWFLPIVTVMFGLACLLAGRSIRRKGS